MAKYEVAFTRDVIQVGSILVEAENPEAAMAKARRFDPREVVRAVRWQDDTSGAPYAIAASDEPKEATSG